MENHSRRMAHGDPPPARTPSREQRSSFFSFFTRQHYNILLTSLNFAELVELYTLHGERPPATSIFRHERRSSELRCNLSDNSDRRDDH